MTFVNLEGDEVFLIDPRHAPFVQGESPHLGEDTLGCMQRVVIVILVLMSVALFLSQTIIEDAETRTDATIIELVEDGVVDEPVYIIVFAFTQEDGSEETLELEIDDATFRSLQDDETVPVRYIPGQPESALLDLERGTNEVIILLGLLLLYIVYVAIFWILRPLMQRNRLESEGVLLKAQLANIYPIGRPGRGYLVRLEYVYTSPDGETVSHKITRNRPDLRENRLPKIGTPLAVLYVNRRLHRLM